MTPPQHDNLQTKAVPISTGRRYFWIIFVLGAITAVCFFFINARDQRVLAQQLIDAQFSTAANNMQSVISELLSQPHLAMAVVEQDVTSYNLVNAQDMKPFAAHAQMRLRHAFPDLSAIAFGGEGFYGSGGRNNDNSFFVEFKDSSTNGDRWEFNADELGRPHGEVLYVTENYNAGLKPWYRAAIASDQAVWSEVYVWSTTEWTAGNSLLATGLNKKIYSREGKFLGVLNIEFLLSRLDKYLRKAADDNGLVAFILESDGKLIASSEPEKTYLNAEGDPIRLTLDTIANPHGPFFRDNLSETLASHAANQRKEFFYALGEQRFHGIFLPLLNEPGAHWVLALAVPEPDAQTLALAHWMRTSWKIALMYLFLFLFSIYLWRRTTGHFDAVKRWAQAPLPGKGGSFPPHPARDPDGMFAMALELKQHLHQLDLELDKAKQSLDQTFLTRAMELEAANIKLIAEIEEKLQVEQYFQGSLEAKTNFVAVMSHELRTPLNGVVGSIKALDRMKLPASAKEVIATARHSARRLTNLINDLLDLSNIEAGKLNLESHPFDTRRCLRECEDNWRDRALAKGLKLLFVVDPNLPEAIDGDENRIRQVIGMLLDNAIKFTESGHITLRAFALPLESRGPRWAFSIQDTGIGIPKAKQYLLFDVNQVSAEPTTRRHQQGTGLGLLVVKSLVDLMGGEIDLVSDEGKGTKFTINLPLVISFNLAEIEAQAALDNYHPARPLKVAVIDDTPVNRTVCEYLLGAEGHQIFGFDSGTAALAGLANIADLDLILMDYYMPEMDGIETTAAIKALASPLKDVPIVLLSGDTRHEVRDKAIAAGAIGAIPKPFELSDLWPLLVNHLPMTDKPLPESNVGELAPESSTASNRTDTTHWVDFEDLATLTKIIGKPGILGLLNSLEQDVTTGLNNVNAALEAQDWEKLHAAAHRMKGSAAEMRLSRLSTDAQALEDLSETTNPGNKLAEMKNLASSLPEVARQSFIAARDFIGTF